eukprot:6483859-Amphidinium_carterae.1
MKRWLKRHVAGPDEQRAMRPQKRHRVSTLTYLRQVDNLLQVSCGWSGLVKVKLDVGVHPWTAENVEFWPKVALVTDQGPDMVSGFYAAAYGQGCNVDALWDLSHGVHNDTINALKGVKSWQFVLLLLVTVNLPHGPQQDEAMRFAQLVESSQAMYTRHEPHNCPLFQSHAPNILKELGSKVELTSTESPELTLWRHLKEESKWPKLGGKTRLCKFAGWLRAVRSLLPEWSKTLMHCEYLGIEADLLSSKSSRSALKLKMSASSQAIPSSTSASVPQPDQKLLKGAQ